VADEFIFSLVAAFTSKCAKARLASAIRALSRFLTALPCCSKREHSSESRSNMVFSLRSRRRDQPADAQRLGGHGEPRPATW